MKNWYALYVNVRHEKKIVQKLLEKGMEAYVPMIKKMKQWSDRKKTIEVPLISGYIFANLSANELDKPKFISGHVNYVKFGGKPAIIRAEEIAGLKYFVSKGYFLEEANSEELKVGDVVKFAMADFKSFTAVVEDIVGDNYAIISFEGVAMNFKLKAPLQSLKREKTGLPANRQFGA